MSGDNPYLVTRADVAAACEAAAEASRRRWEALRARRPSTPPRVPDPGRDDHDFVQAVIGKVWDGVDVCSDEIALAGGLDRATAGQRAVYAVMFSNSEICNGGFHQYFHNSTGILWPEAIAGLRMIAAPQRADLLVRAAARFPGGVAPRDREQRMALLDATSFEGWEAFFRPLEDAYYAIDKEQRAESLCAAYIDAHPAEFFVSLN